MTTIDDSEQIEELNALREEAAEQSLEVTDELDVVRDEAQTAGDAGDEKEEGPKPYRPELPEAEARGAPPWVKIPNGFKFPRGRQVLFLKFRAEWTDAPWKGDELTGLDGKWRQCICWPISIGDKKVAFGRAKSDPNRASDELTLQMIRAIDGREVKWDGLPEGRVEDWWNEIGERCRNLLTKVFLQLHSLDRSQQQDFFENCIAVRTTG
jgi:hypothetical protein